MDSEEGRPDGQGVSIKEQLTEEGRDARRSLMKREKYWANNVSLGNTVTNSKGVTLVILKNKPACLSKKKNLSPMSKAKGEASRNQFMK